MDTIPASTANAESPTQIIELVADYQPRHSFDYKPGDFVPEAVRAPRVKVLVRTSADPLRTYVPRHAAPEAGTR